MGIFILSLDDVKDSIKSYFRDKIKMEPAYVDFVISREDYSLSAYVYTNDCDFYLTEGDILEIVGNIYNIDIYNFGYNTKEEKFYFGILDKVS